VGANYRAVCRARSRREFVAKLSIVIEECDEALFWLEMTTDLKLASSEKVAALVTEGNEILSIVLAARRTAESRLRRPNQQSAISNQQ
jgi:four helix bundle protein